MTDIKKKGVRIHIGEDTNTKGIYACSECLYQVGYRNKFCPECGVILAPMSVGGNIDNVIRDRDEYREDETTGYEEEPE